VTVLPTFTETIRHAAQDNLLCWAEIVVDGHDPFTFSDAGLWHRDLQSSGSLLPQKPSEHNPFPGSFFSLPSHRKGKPENKFTNPTHHGFIFG
jgi:hypothetical protein